MFPDTNDRLRDLMVRGIAAAKAGSRDEARRYLELALAAGPGPSEYIKIWRALADIAADAGNKRSYLEQILTVDPTDGLARRDLAVLDGRLAAIDIIDPNHPAGAPEPALAGAALVCRSCGSPDVAFDDGRNAIVCRHCGAVQPASAGHAAAAARDFAATMWTEGAHRLPSATPCVTCTGCGATFIAPPGQLSMTCPYCSTAYAIERVETRQVIEPDGIAPFAITKSQAEAAVATWLRERGFDPQPVDLRGLFEPAWIFNFVGSVNWRGLRASGRAIEPASGSYPITDRLVRVAATARARRVLACAAAGVDTAHLQPYDSRVLAGHPAALYDITLDQAVLTARPIAIEHLRAELGDELGDIQQLSMDFSPLGVDVFTLALVPVWAGELSARGARIPVLVGGRTGDVCADLPAGAVRRALSAILSRLGLTVHFEL